MNRPDPHGSHDTLPPTSGTHGLYNAPGRVLLGPGIEGTMNHFMPSKVSHLSGTARHQIQPLVETQKHPAGKDPMTGFHSQIVDISRLYDPYNNPYHETTAYDSHRLDSSFVDTRNMDRAGKKTYFLG